MLTLQNVTVTFHADTPNEVTALNSVSLNVASAPQFHPWGCAQIDPFH